MKLSIIIVVYNSFYYLEKCLTSLYTNNHLDMEIIIIDNASTEKGLTEILSNFKNIILIKNRKNEGFGKGANKGLKRAIGKYILILNPDTVVLKNTFNYLLDKMDNNPYMDLSGGKILDQNYHQLQSAGYAFPSIFSHLYEYNYPFCKLINIILPDFHPLLYNKEDHYKEMNVKHLMGAFLLFRKSTFKKIGGFDERFFLYREETDICKRILESGGHITYLPLHGGIIHIGAASSKVKITQSSPHYMESTYRFFRKYHSPLYVSIAYVIGLTSSFIDIIYFLLKANRENVKAWKQTFFWHLINGLHVLSL